tara:strand:+ start:670 stop:879 length:210 start_codon:yes stop_codon:yes gene_type:complete
MARIIYSPDFPEGKLEEFTAEEIAVNEQGTADTSFKDEQANQETLKASARAKLMSGEALTEDEAKTVVI